MPCRLTSSTKTPSPWTRRLSSLRGMFWPAKPRCGASVSSTTSASVGAIVSLMRRHLLARGDADCVDDVPVTRAAADVALEPLPDLLRRRLRVLAQQGSGAHQHPGGAVAALERVTVAERLLQRRELAAGRQALDRLDLGAVGLDGKEHAALHQLAVDDHGAGAAVAGVATDVAAGEIEVVADEVHEQASALDLALVRRPVHLDRDRPARRGLHQLLRLA